MKVGGLVECVEDFRGVVAVVVRIALAPDHLRAEPAQGVLEPLRHGDTREGGERLALEPFERKLLSAPHVLEKARGMATLDDLGLVVVFADAADDVG